MGSIQRKRILKKEIKKFNVSVLIEVDEGTSCLYFLKLEVLKKFSLVKLSLL